MDWFLYDNGLRHERVKSHHYHSKNNGKNLNKLEFTIISEKARFMVVGGANQRLMTISPTQEYLDRISSTC